MSIYLSNGYLDMESILNNDYTFCFIVGGRGTGKTFGALNAAIHRDNHFIYMRRTQAELDIVNKPEFNPFKAVNLATGTDIYFKPISKDSAGIYSGSDDLIGYTVALSTIAKLRSFDASDCDLVIYDEFIPEKHARPIKEEGSAFLNAYETINRNREFNGVKPVKMVCLANANRADNPIFMELGLISVVEKMKNKGLEVWTDRNRSIMVICLGSSPISSMKKETALYKLTKGSDFERMSLENNFAYDDFSGIAPQKLIEYKPFTSVGEITIYKHKSKTQYYVSEHRTGSPDHYGVSERELTSYRQHYWRLWDRYIDGFVLFENYLTKSLFIKYTYG